MNRIAPFSRSFRPFSRAVVHHTRFAVPVVLSNVPSVRYQPFSTPTQAFLDKKEVLDRVLNVMKNFEKVEASKVKETSKFIDDLGLDSLDVVEVVMAMEEEFVIEIPDNEAEKLRTPTEVVEYIVAHPMAK